MGDIRIHRRLFDSDLWQHKPFSRGQAWIDLIGLANWKGNEVVIKDQNFHLERGQLVGSYRFLGKRWGWGAKRVSNLCQTLKRQQRILLSTQHQTTVITICKYETYQTPLNYKATVKATVEETVRQQSGNSEATKQRTEEERKKNKTPLARPKADPRVSEVFKYWDSKYKALTGEKYLFAGAKEGSLIKRLLKTYERDKSLDLIDYFFKEAEEPNCWWRDKVSVGTFSSCVPKIIRQITGGIKDGQK